MTAASQLAKKLHIRLDHSSLKGKANLKRAFVQWIAGEYRGQYMESMFQVATDDLRLVHGYFSKWSNKKLEGYIADFLAEWPAKMMMVMTNKREVAA
jgi:hypothetical protein